MFAVIACALPALLIYMIRMHFGPDVTSTTSSIAVTQLRMHTHRSRLAMLIVMILCVCRDGVRTGEATKNEGINLNTAPRLFSSRCMQICSGVRNRSIVIYARHLAFARVILFIPSLCVCIQHVCYEWCLIVTTIGIVTRIDCYFPYSP